MAQQGRVQVRDLQSDVRLRPAPMQSDTYAAPARLQGDQNLARLSDALGSFSNSLGNLVPVMGAVDKEARVREDAIFNKRIAGMTLPEVRKEISEGRMAVTEDKFSNAARQTVYGNKWAQSEAAAAEQELMTTFDWDNGNPEEYLAKRFQTAIETSGLSDPNAIASASRAWDQFKTSVLAKQEKYRIDRTNQSTMDTAFTVIHDKASEWIKLEMKPTDFAENLNRMRHELGPRGALGAGPEALDREYLNAADRLAVTNPEYAIAMLDAEYEGRGGKTTLSDQREYRDRVLQIKAQAAKAIGERTDKNVLQSFDMEADSLLVDDRLDRLTDKTYTDRNGEQKTVKANQLKDEAFNRYLERSPEIAKGNKEEPRQTMARELRKAQFAGIEHPRLKAAVTGIASAASPDMMQDPEAMETLMEKVNTARWLQDTSKNTYMAYTTEADRDFMESFRIAKDSLTGADGRQYSDTAALEFATRTSQPVTVDGLNFTRDQNDKIDASVKKLATTPGWLWGENAVTPWNAAAGQNRVAGMAKRLVRGGMDQDKAIEVATESVKRNSITYNGMLLQVGKTALPENYKETLDDIIGGFAKSNPGILKDREIDTGDISIMPIGDINVSGGRFALFDKETGSYLMDDKTGQPFFVSLQSIRDRGREIEDQKFQKAANDVTVNGAASARGLTRQEDAEGNTFFLNPDTRETFTIEVPEAGGKPVITNRGKRLPNRGTLFPRGTKLPQR